MDSLVISNNHPWNFDFLRSIANSTCQSNQVINLINRDSRDLRAEYNFQSKRHEMSMLRWVRKIKECRQEPTRLLSTLVMIPQFTFCIA